MTRTGFVSMYTSACGVSRCCAGCEGGVSIDVVCVGGTATYLCCCLELGGAGIPY